MWYFVPIPLRTANKHSVSGDVTAFLSPFAASDTDWRNFRVGIGPSVRVAGMMFAVNNVNSMNGEWIDYILYTRQHAVGGHAAVQYLLPLSSNEDICLHGQVTMFAPSFYTIGNNIPFAPA